MLTPSSWPFPCPFSASLLSWPGAFSAAAAAAAAAAATATAAAAAAVSTPSQTSTASAMSDDVVIKASTSPVSVKSDQLSPNAKSATSNDNSSVYTPSSISNEGDEKEDQENAEREIVEARRNAWLEKAQNDLVAGASPSLIGGLQYVPARHPFLMNTSSASLPSSDSAMSLKMYHHRSPQNSRSEPPPSTNSVNWRTTSTVAASAAAPEEPSNEDLINSAEPQDLSLRTSPQTLHPTDAKEPVASSTPASMTEPSSTPQTSWSFEEQFKQVQYVQVAPSVITLLLLQSDRGCTVTSYGKPTQSVDEYG
ncbi:unnamed protein product [Soboliphyme baturini]|uniref:Uncharacterized protein n=1 Tax=Soboliphyme baturini TaxID=241478 RepID=A0A183IYI3_9BILA|nr:unnamed protein product [Soboliphyme baturini]